MSYTDFYWQFWNFGIAGDSLNMRDQSEVNKLYLIVPAPNHKPQPFSVLYTAQNHDSKIIAQPLERLDTASHIKAVQ